MAEFTIQVRAGLTFLGRLDRMKIRFLTWSRPVSRHLPRKLQVLIFKSAKASAKRLSTRNVGYYAKVGNHGD